MDIFTKVCSVIINIVLAAASFAGAILGLVYICPFGFLGSGLSVNVSDFIKGWILIAAAFILPAAVNSKLYRIWYGEEELSKKWINIPIAIILTGVCIISVGTILFDNYIYGWYNAKWYW
ncbi:MAG: hypothetical protein ACI4JF_02440 [Oscillospiraceae bacterium]